MKHKHLLMLAVMALSAVTAGANDFTAVSPGGHSLYYTIHGKHVTLVGPQTAGAGSMYGESERPAGAVVIPSTVSHQGTTYTVTRIDETAFINCAYITLPDSIYFPVHDTLYVEVPYAVHDTTLLHDTAFVDVPYAVHDTTVVFDTAFVDVPYAVHDTIVQHDTAYIEVPYTVHDTTVVTLTDTVTHIVVDTVETIVVDTLVLTDTLWLTDTVVVHDTVYLGDTTAIGEVENRDVSLYQQGGQLVVEGAADEPVRLYDAVGRPLATKQDYSGLLRFDVPASGTYLLRVGQRQARRIVVVR